MNSNRFIATVFGILISLLFSIAAGIDSVDALQPVTNNNDGPRQGRLFFPFPGLPGNGEGSPGNVLNCRPFNRTFVQQGLLCLRPNMTALSCRNETCTCSSSSNAGRPPIIPFPLPNLPTLPGISTWNCTEPASNSTTTAKPPTNSTTTKIPETSNEARE